MNDEQATHSEHVYIWDGDSLCLRTGFGTPGAPVATLDDFPSLKAANEHYARQREQISHPEPAAIS